MNYIPQSWPVIIEYWTAEEPGADEGTIGTIIGWKLDPNDEALPIVMLNGGGAFALTTDDSWRVRG